MLSSFRRFRGANPRFSSNETILRASIASSVIDGASKYILRKNLIRYVFKNIFKNNKLKIFFLFITYLDSSKSRSRPGTALIACTKVQKREL